MERIRLVEIYRDYIRKEGNFDYGLDDLERVGFIGILSYYRLDWEALTEDEQDELWDELKQMAEENDYIRDFELINQEG